MNLETWLDSRTQGRLLYTELGSTADTTNPNLLSTSSYAALGVWGNWNLPVGGSLGLRSEWTARAAGRPGPVKFPLWNTERERAGTEVTASESWCPCAALRATASERRPRLRNPPCPDIRSNIRGRSRPNRDSQNPDSRAESCSGASYARLHETIEDEVAANSTIQPFYGALKWVSPLRGVAPKS
jgi:hypothetical protein